MGSQTRIGIITTASAGNRTLRIEMPRSYVAYALSLQVLECIKKDGTAVKCRVASIKKSNDGIIAKVVPGVPRDTIAQLKKCSVVTSDESFTRDTERYDSYELSGLSVIDADGMKVGTVEAGFETRANGMMEITLRSGGVVLLPIVPEVVDSLDWNANEVRLMPDVPLDDDGVQA